MENDSTADVAARFQAEADDFPGGPVALGRYVVTAVRRAGVAVGAEPALIAQIIDAMAASSHFPEGARAGIRQEAATGGPS